MRRIAILSVCLACGGQAWAEQLFEVRLTDRVLVGARPGLEVQIYGDLERLELDLTRDDGQALHEVRTRVPRGSRRGFELPQTEGVHRWRGSLRVQVPSGEEASMALDFETSVLGPLGLTVQQDGLDLASHSVTVEARRPLARVEYEIVAETGAALGKGVFEPPAPRTPLAFRFEQEPGRVLKIRLVGHDRDGFFEELFLFPWSFSVPHEEVEFESGQAEIRPGERPKLDRSYALLGEGIAKYGRLLPIKLYIAGFTDTVAAADYNQGLSERRALAIARYFREKGFRYPIFFLGLGERGLKVLTPDETDEPRNRRAEYVLAAEPPSLGVSGGRMGWSALP